MRLHRTTIAASVVALTLGVTGAVVATGDRAPVTELEYVTAAGGDTYATIAADLSCDGPALRAANGRAPLEPGTIVLIPPMCQGDVAPPPATTMPPATTAPPTTAPSTTMPPSTGDPAVTFAAIPHSTPDAKPARYRGNIQWSVSCPYTDSRRDDPIVFPGQPGRAHLHDFFGTRGVNAYTTIAELQHLDSNCTTSNDRSAYWAPTLYQDGQRVRPGNTTFYYKAAVDPVESVQPIPFGLQMIAGNAMATSIQSPRITWFQEGNRNTPNSSGGVMPNKPQLRVVFPDCWDGERLTSRDQSHVAYNRNRACPASHPVPIIQVVMFVQYPDNTNISLSSGHWRTAHADFINAWHPDTMADLIDECIVTRMQCGRVRGR